MNKKHNQHGGRRPNQTGRPAKPPNEKRVKVAITLPPDLHQRTAGSRSRIIEAALNFYFTNPTSKMEYRFSAQKSSSLQIVNEIFDEDGIYICDLIVQDNQSFYSSESLSDEEMKEAYPQLPKVI
jgi:hypothetical protein